MISAANTTKFPPIWNNTFPPLLPVIPLPVRRGLHAGCRDYFADRYHVKRHFGQTHTAACLGQTFGDRRQLIPCENCNLFI